LIILTSQLHEYSLDTDTWLFPVLPLLIWHSCYIDSHVCMLWLFLYFYCMDYYSCYMDYCYLIFLYYCYMNISWISYMTVSVFLISIWYSCYLDIPTIDLRCAELSATRNKVPHHIHGVAASWTRGATSKVSHLMDLMSLVSCYSVTCYYYYFWIVKYNKYNMGWGKLDGWLGLVRWMSWIHISPTVGDVVVLATVYYSSLSFLFPVSS